MNKSTLTIFAAIFGVAIIGAFAVLLMPAPPVAQPTATTQETAAAKPQNVSGSNFQFDGSAPATPSTAAAPPEAPAEAPENAAQEAAKEQTLSVIHDAMTTWSEEGVPVIQPYLSSPDKTIRAAAIESMKQLGVPEAAAALRAAAKKTTNPEERKAMLEAAEFAELPPLIGPAAQGR
jgi:hypothetical protein